QVDHELGGVLGLREHGLELPWSFVHRCSASTIPTVPSPAAAAPGPTLTGGEPARPADRPRPGLRGLPAGRRRPPLLLIPGARVDAGVRAAAPALPPGDPGAGGRAGRRHAARPGPGARLRLVDGHRRP